MNRGTDRIEPVLAWRRVSAESARMTGLVVDLLLVARLDEGRTLEEGEVDLAAAVAEAVWDGGRRGPATCGNWRCIWTTPRLWSPATMLAPPGGGRPVGQRACAHARWHDGGG